MNIKFNYSISNVINFTSTFLFNYLKEKSKQKKMYQIYETQKIPAEISEIWDFISAPANLKKITPTYMGFDITSIFIPKKMYPGMIISYIVKPVLGIKTT